MYESQVLKFWEKKVPEYRREIMREKKNKFTRKKLQIYKNKVLKLWEKNKNVWRWSHKIIRKNLWKYRCEIMTKKCKLYKNKLITLWEKSKKKKKREQSPKILKFREKSRFF